MSVHRWLWGVAWPLAVVLPYYGVDFFRWLAQHFEQGVIVWTLAGIFSVLGFLFGRWKP